MKKTGKRMSAGFHQQLINIFIAIVLLSMLIKVLFL
ncbi:hypothetical protein CLV59_10554 [Chitinophaga dinghuensis]|uniref:Uncharacterized protein n=1 Tax=Chitinophaga dinghuensis TaxID=1539050 RepID=A0A327VVJ9_9BACT|nr:hypothetical protein CLV59_10554 [Chitinophaga dinghuensis]